MKEVQNFKALTLYLFVSGKKDGRPKFTPNLFPFFSFSWAQMISQWIKVMRRVSNDTMYTAPRCESLPFIRCVKDCTVVFGEIEQGTAIGHVFSVV